MLSSVIGGPRPPARGLIRGLDKPIQESFESLFPRLGGGRHCVEVDCRFLDGG